MPKEQDELMDHEYDGIREYDNPLPRWWIWMFYASIVYALIYTPYIMFGFGPSSQEEYEMEMAAARKPAMQSAPAGGTGTPAQEKPAGGFDTSMEGNAAAIAAGASIYGANCAPCHAPQGQGLIGPNLTDKNWIHGNTFIDISQVISNGVPDKGMISWKSTLNPTKISQVTAYVLSLGGTTPPNPKAPEGKLYP